MLDEKASTISRRIKDSNTNGPFADAFRRIQAAEGNALRAEADRFHATPYGHCLNWFMVDRCPKHFECYVDCPTSRQLICRRIGRT
ncbi:hypothetical protein [Paraburkholderia haematera]|uniref:Uncharacterized protein n=1 Tax=Paraburkholderia haematera TaxID=2793077 RepID=A0ABN7MBE7_9BURK|nr:hypothetical protein [Paraburkholderia haematera]CAE6794937.1 hypothetical protein R69888_04934 [Paraburkholderia haematera]